MKDQQLTTSLDVNEQFPVDMRVSATPDGTFKLHATIDMSQATNEQFVKNICDLSAIAIGGKSHYFTRKGDLLTCEAFFDKKQEADSLDLLLNNIPISRFIPHDNGLTPVLSQRDYKLTVSETRMLSFPMTETQLRYLPYPRTYAGHLHEYRMPITDLHTHLSSQLSAEKLVQIAITHDLAYPVELLDEAGVDYRGLALHPVSAFRFSPAINNGFARECEKDPRQADADKLKGVKLAELKASRPDAFRKLLQHMSIPADDIYGPDDFDRLFYRFRNPLEKNPVLAHDKIMQVAADYARQGVRYAELSTGAMLDDPSWLRDAVPAIEEAEQKYGVKLRLLAGIPRTSSPGHVARLIEKFKFVNQCPYVVGVDFLGYESNKTGDFRWALYNLARWARRLRNGVQESDEFSSYKDDPILRVHAGENNENMNNVNEVIEIARKFNVSMRIGHAVFANYTPQLLSQAKDAHIIMESILPSNIALNNLLYPHASSIRKWVEAGVNFVEGTDGAGAYQLTIDQLARDALHAGLTPKDLDKRQQFEEEYIRQRQRIFDDKKSAFEQNYPSFNAFMDAYTAHAAQVDSISSGMLPKRFADKTPLLIAGASGESWKDIVDQDTGRTRNDPTRMAAQISIADRILTEMLDSNKVFFPSGRVKDRGVEKETDKAIEQHDRKHWRKAPPFDMTATTSRGDGTVSIANGVTWINEHRLQNVPKEVIDFMQRHARVQPMTDAERAAFPNLDPKGCYAMFIGGKGMTSEFIRFARKQELPHGLVKGPVGTANNEIARACANDKETISNDERPLAEAIVKAVFENLGPGVFDAYYRAQMKDEASVDKCISACYQEILKEPRSHISAATAMHSPRVR